MRIVSYFSPFFVNDKVFNKKTKTDGVIVELIPLEKAFIQWESGEAEWIDISKCGDMRNVGKIVEWDE